MKRNPTKREEKKEQELSGWRYRTVKSKSKHKCKDN